jgi:hypothetical protein
VSIRRNGSMRGEIRELAKSVNAPAQPQLRVRDWYEGEAGDLIARRREVWLLLRWYHHRYVLPNLGVRGFIRRVWVRFFGKKLHGHNVELAALESPWKDYELRAMIRAALEQIEAEKAASNPGAEPATEPEQAQPGPIIEA